MSVFYPYALASLNTDGKIPADASAIEHVQAKHFNRLFREVTAVEATLGTDIGGNLDRLLTRLAVSMNSGGLQAGALTRELICDGDPTGGLRGTTRYWDAQGQEALFDFSAGFPLKHTAEIKLAYNVWQDPPCLLFTPDTTLWTKTEAAFHGRQVIISHNELLSVVAFLDHQGRRSGGVAGMDLHWLAISSKLNVWEDDKAWALPPVRTGG